MIVGVGTDIVELERFRQALIRTPKLRTKLFSPAEIAYCEKKSDPFPSFAVRFAAKEAVFKALGTGIAGFQFHDVEVLMQSSGQPLVQLHGDYAALASRRGVARVHLSLSHERDYVVAFAVAEGQLVCDGKKE